MQILHILRIGSSFVLGSKITTDCFLTGFIASHICYGSDYSEVIIQEGGSVM